MCVSVCLYISQLLNKGKTTFFGRRELDFLVFPNDHGDYHVHQNQATVEHCVCWN